MSSLFLSYLYAWFVVSNHMFIRLDAHAYLFVCFQISLIVFIYTAFCLHIFLFFKCFIVYFCVCIQGYVLIIFYLPLHVCFACLVSIHI